MGTISSHFISDFLYFLMAELNLLEFCPIPGRGRGENPNLSRAIIIILFSIPGLDLVMSKGRILVGDRRNLAGFMRKGFLLGKAIHKESTPFL